VRVEWGSGINKGLSSLWRSGAWWWITKPFSLYYQRLNFQQHEQWSSLTQPTCHPSWWLLPRSLILGSLFLSFQRLPCFLSLGIFVFLMFSYCFSTLNVLRSHSGLCTWNPSQSVALVNWSIWGSKWGLDKTFDSITQVRKCLVAAQAHYSGELKKSLSNQVYSKLFLSKFALCMFKRWSL